MTVTETYTCIHRALAYATPEGAVPFDVRMLVAIAELGGSASTDELEAWLDMEGSAVRRSALKLYALDLALGQGVDGGRVRRGVRSRLSITANGERIVALFRELVGKELVAA